MLDLLRLPQAFPKGAGGHDRDILDVPESKQRGIARHETISAGSTG